MGEGVRRSKYYPYTPSPLQQVRRAQAAGSPLSHRPGRADSKDLLQRHQPSASGHLVRGYGVWVCFSGGVFYQASDGNSVHNDCVVHARGWSELATRAECQAVGKYHSSPTNFHSTSRNTPKCRVCHTVIKVYTPPPTMCLWRVWLQSWCWPAPICHYVHRLDR